MTDNNNLGIADVYLDGTFVTTIDLYSPSAEFQQVVYETGELTPGQHTLRIVATGTEDASSAGSYVDWDALLVAA